ncbi:MAG: vWA domain-containing protein [Bacillota bacterium]
MRIKYNLILLVIIAALLLAIVEFVSWPLHRPQDLRVNQDQLATLSEVNNLEIVWDVSGSMWGKLDENRKYTTSQQILNELVIAIPEHVKIGLRVFGAEKMINHHQLAVNVSTNNQDKLLTQISNLQPAGRSPIGQALSQAGLDLIDLEGNNHILLVTDGKDTGNLNPVRVASRLCRNGVQVHILYVGKLAVTEEKLLQEVAEAGGGKYFTYSNHQVVVPTMNLID